MNIIEDKFSKIKSFWQEAGLKDKDEQGLKPTARDPFLQKAVEDAILRYLPRNQDILDVGCGEATSTIKFAAHSKRVLGIDYSETLIEQAIENARREKIENVQFVNADVTHLNTVETQMNAVFDIAISIRCLINLPSFELQCKGFSEISRCLKSGGLFFLSEGWREGWEGLNRERLRCGLSEVTVAEYNLLIGRGDFEKMYRDTFDLVAYHSLGLYLFMSRIVQPFMIFPESPKHDHVLNRVGCDLERMNCLPGKFEDIDYAGVYILRKK